MSCYQTGLILAIIFCVLCGGRCEYVFVCMSVCVCVHMQERETEGKSNKGEGERNPLCTKGFS